MMTIHEDQYVGPTYILSKTVWWKRWKWLLKFAWWWCFRFPSEWRPNMYCGHKIEKNGQVREVVDYNHRTVTITTEREKSE